MSTHYSIEKNYAYWGIIVDSYVRPYIPPYGVFVVLGSLAVGTFFRTIFKAINFPISEHVIVFCFGLGAGALTSVDFIKLHVEMLSDDMSVILYVLEPVLIMKIMTRMDIYTFNRSWHQIMLISILGYLLNVLLIGMIVELILGNSHLKLLEGLIVSAMICGIYSVEVVDKLRSKGWNSHVCILMDGESAFTITLTCAIEYFLIYIKLKYMPNTTDYIEFFFLNVCICSLIGLLMGKLLCLCLYISYNDVAKTLLFVVMVPIFTFYVTKGLLRLTGGFPVIIIGYILSAERSRLSTVSETFLIHTHDIAEKIVLYTVYFLVGGFITHDLYAYVDIKDYALIFVLYAVATVGRLLSIGILIPILCKLGYGFTFTDTVFIIWGGITSPTSMMLSLLLRKHGVLYELNNKIPLYVIGVNMLTLLVNNSTMGLLANLFGSLQHTSSNYNLRNCLKYIMIYREHKIRLMKLDKLLANANWIVVKEETVLRDISKNHLPNEEEEDDDYFSLKSIKCPECHKEVYEELSPKQYATSLEEAQKRVLKVMRISFSRQFERGLVSKAIIRVLHLACDVSMDDKDKHIRLEELHKLFRKEDFWAKARAVFLSLLGESIIRKPQTYWRRKCYHVVRNWKVKMFMDIVILLHVLCCLAWSIYYILHEPTVPYAVGVAGKIFYLITYVPFIFEFIFKIAAYSWMYICSDGFKGYFKDPVNVFDFVMLILDTIVIFFPQPFQAAEYYKRVFLFILCLRLLRLLRMLNFLQAKLIKCNERKVDSQIAFAYTVGKAIMTATEDVLEVLDFLVDNQKVREDIRNRTEQDRLDICRELGIVQKEKPWIAMTVKTKQAMMTILNSMHEAIEDLKSSGWTDDSEHEQLSLALENLYKRVKNLNTITPTSPKVILKEVPWMSSEEMTSEYLYDNVSFRTFQPGDTVVYEGTLPTGIYVVVTGMLKMIYVPEQDVLKALESKGEIPVMDYIPSHNFSNNITEYIVSGNTIGELCFLTKRPYNCRIVAETYCQMYLLTNSALENAIMLSNDPLKGLEARMWKHINIKLCVSILMNMPSYRTVTQNQIKLMLENGFVPTLKDGYKILVVNDSIANVILLHGVIYDFFTNVKFVAPCYIPKTSKKLIINPEDEETEDSTRTVIKFMIIPSTTMNNYALLISDKGTSFFDNASQKCLLHTIKDASKEKSKSLLGRKVTVACDEEATLITDYADENADEAVKVEQLDDLPICYHSVGRETEIRRTESLDEPSTKKKSSKLIAKSLVTTQALTPHESYVLSSEEIAKLIEKDIIEKNSSSESSGSRK